MSILVWLMCECSLRREMWSRDWSKFLGFGLGYDFRFVGSGVFRVEWKRVGSGWTKNELFSLMGVGRGLRVGVGKSRSSPYTTFSALIR